MHLHDRGGSRANGTCKISEMGAVGGTDLPQAGASTRHHVGDAKGAADFNQFAAGHQHVAPICQAVQRQQDGRGVVVHDDRVLRAGQAADQADHMVVALAAPAGLQVVFQVAGIRRRCHRGDGFRRQWGPT